MATSFENLTDRQLMEELLRTQRANLRVQLSILMALVDNSGFEDDPEEQNRLVERIQREFNL